MFKRSLHLKIMVPVLFCVVAVGLLYGYPAWGKSFPKASNPTHIAKQRPLLTTIVIPKAQDLFTPFLLAVPLHSMVTWRNDDIVEHVVTTTMQRSNFLNPQAFSSRIPAGQQVHFTFNQAGLYHYYDTTTSIWNSRVSRVDAKKGTPHFPLAMDGVLWIQGTISGLTNAAIDPIVAGHDEFTEEFVAISHPGGVTWHNFDQDPHFIGLVSGWSAPVNAVDIGLNRILGTVEAPGGGLATIIFNTPGLYYYYCRNHGRIDPLTHRAQALPMASEYPIPMAGFVLVL